MGGTREKRLTSPAAALILRRPGTDRTLRFPGPQMNRRFRAALAGLALLAAQQAGAQARLTSPQEQFGHAIGADYQLPNYQQLVAYWQKLATQSDRMRLVEMGRTAEGRTQYMAIVSSP